MHCYTGESMPTLTAHDLAGLLQRHWGYEGFLPQQEEVIAHVLAGCDSVAILPTGGGKSICYQLPALVMPGLAVVVSPLLALMKDQVDSLVANGIPAATLNSTLSEDETRQVMSNARAGQLKLLYLSPERINAPDVIRLLQEVRVSFIAVDEAHCVSHWGHDFRPDYRQLGFLRQCFPGVAIHAFTATATEAVRQDIAGALALCEPQWVIGNFDRPNLLYRAEYRKNLLQQVRQVLDRHPGEAGVVYCIRRSDVDSLSAALKALGHRVLPYHAGLGAEVRQRHQEAFANEEVDVIVATIAFGMGIDRSDVRFVIHTGMPKAIEHYQQEAGRAGRDRLEAECVLFYGANDLLTWKTILGEPQTQHEELAHAKLNEMYRFCRTLSCRHRFLVQYFGQEFEPLNCGACDVCLGEHAALPDSLVVAQKILSCVVRVKENFGARHVAEVLKGSRNAKVLQYGHDQLSTHGLLATFQLGDITDWIDQLIGLGHLARVGEFQVLKLTPTGRLVMRGERDIQLSMPRQTEKKAARSRGSEAAVLDSQEEGVFQHLRGWRRTQAEQRGVPPYLILSDATLRELSRHRPATEWALRQIKGIGESKAAAFGGSLLATLGDYCREQRLSLGEDPEPQLPIFLRSAKSHGAQEAAFEACRAPSGQEAERPL